MALKDGADRLAFRGCLQTEKSFVASDSLQYVVTQEQIAPNRLAGSFGVLGYLSVGCCHLATYLPRYLPEPNSAARTASSVLNVYFCPADKSI